MISSFLYQMTLTSSMAVPPPELGRTSGAERVRVHARARHEGGALLIVGDVPRLQRRMHAPRAYSITVCTCM